MEDKSLKLVEVKVIYETLKGIAAKNDMAFSKQWRFREVMDPYKSAYEGLSEDSRNLTSSKEKDLDAINSKYRELLDVVVLIKNVVSLPRSWFEEKNSEDKQLIINGNDMDILIEYDIIETDKPKPKKSTETE